MKAYKTEQVPHHVVSIVGKYFNERKQRFRCLGTFPPPTYKRVINLVKESQMTSDGCDKMETDD